MFWRMIEKFEDVVNQKRTDIGMKEKMRERQTIVH